jgi:hypothetical protein
MEEKFKKLSELLGENSKIEESPKSLQKKDEAFFQEVLLYLCQMEAAFVLFSQIGIKFDTNESSFIKPIEMLMMKYYGEFKTPIILWWVFDSISPEGDIYPLVDENGKHHTIKTPLQLYKFLKRYDNK